MEVLGTLIAVAFGFALNEAAQWIRHTRAERNQRRNVRALLRLENAQNLKALATFWDRIMSAEGLAPGVGYGGDELEFDRRLRLANFTLPAWGHVMWESQAASLADALSGGELERAYSVHTDLDTFTDVRSRLQEAFSMDEGRKLAANFTEWIEEKRMRKERAMDMTNPYVRDLVNALSEFN